MAQNTEPDDYEDCTNCATPCECDPPVHLEEGKDHHVWCTGSQTCKGTSALKCECLLYYRKKPKTGDDPEKKEFWWKLWDGKEKKAYAPKEENYECRCRQKKPPSMHRR
jgi:hypothetical protein